MQIRGEKKKDVIDKAILTNKSDELGIPVSSGCPRRVGFPKDQESEVLKAFLSQPGLDQIVDCSAIIFDKDKNLKSTNETSCLNSVQTLAKMKWFVLKPISDHVN